MLLTSTRCFPFTRLLEGSRSGKSNALIEWNLQELGADIACFNRGSSEMNWFTRLLVAVWEDMHKKIHGRWLAEPRVYHSLYLPSTKRRYSQSQKVIILPAFKKWNTNLITSLGFALTGSYHTYDPPIAGSKGCWLDQATVAQCKIDSLLNMI